jgi:hypothetical protein
MAQHTPGPWSFENGISCISHKRGEIVARNRAGSQTVAQVAMFSDPSYDGDEDTANARLIAAAPELLDALEELVSDLEFDMSAGCNPRLVKSGKRIEYARAAISKATGESA